METWVGTVVSHIKEPKTRQNYTLHARRMAVLFGDLCIDRITRATLARMQATMATPEAVARVKAYTLERYGRVGRGPKAGDGYGASTINGTLAALRNAWNWAAELRYTPAVMPKFSSMPVNRVFTDYTPSQDEIEAAIASVTSVAVQRALWIQAATGARVSEITQRRVGDIDRVEGQGETLTVWLAIRKTKTKVDRVIPVRRWVGRLLLDMAAGRDPSEMLFLHAGHRDDDGSDDVARIVKRMRCDIGKPVSMGFASAVQAQLRRLDWAKLDGPRFTPHGERRCFINTALDSNQPIDRVAAFCGNSPGTIARHYREIQPGHLLDVVARGEAVDEGKVTPFPRKAGGQ